uniref:HAT C-terminal dimerisation domain-containing protein n=1 Tax=Panagrolaimus davidi TaxID=227884 RepID=A0A914QAD5_9BILA
MLIGTVSKEHATAHEKCAKSANSVIKHAKCVSKLLQLPSIKNQPKLKSEKEKKALFARLKPEQIHQPINPLNPRNPSSKLQKLGKSKRIIKYGKKQKQRKHQNKSKSQTKSNRNISNFKLQNPRKLQNHFISTYRFQPQPRRYMGAKAINFNPNQNHRRFNPNHFFRQQFFQENRKYKKVGEFEVLAKRRKRYSIKSDSQYFLQNSELNLTPIGKVAQNLIKTVLDIKNKTETVPWQRTMDKAREIAALRKEIRIKSRMLENPDPYEAMAFKGLNLGKGDLMDILDDPNERKQFINSFKTNRKGPTSKLMGLFRDGMKLTHLLLGKNISNFDERTIKLLSPRLFSVTEDDKGDEGDNDDPLNRRNKVVLKKNQMWPHRTEFDKYLKLTEDDHSKIDNYFRNKKNTELRQLAFDVSDSKEDLVHFSTIFAPFQEAIRRLERDKSPTMYKVLETFYSLKEKITSFNNSDIPMLSELSISILAVMDHKERILINDNHLISVTLDPSKKNDLFNMIGREKFEIIKQKFEDIIRGIAIESSGETFNPYLQNNQLTAEVELNMHYTEQITDPSFDLLAWWSIISARFPRISKLAGRLLCIPVSSASIERLLSTLKLLTPAERSSLLPESISKIVLYRSLQLFAQSSIDVLSPSLLSLHGNGKGFERELSLPNLIKGFTTADQQQWLDLIFEASGVEETLQKANDALIAEEFQARKKRSYEETMRTSDGQPLYFTKEKAIEILGENEKNRTELHETLIKSYTPKQLKEINENGYAILNSMQLELLYGPNSPHKNLKMIENFGNRSEESIHEQIYDEIHQLATNVSFQRRQKDIVLSPILFSNFLFVPEQTSTPLFKSQIIEIGPWGFLPLIASPRTLSPAILTPFFFVPVIMSPLTLHPLILCPGLFNPFVLSPLLLAPLILSPQVFTPLILSPLALSPFILNPSVGTPLVLSPFVLTPVIFSPLALFALVLSPNALSPVIQSKLIGAEIILSPSWLS